MSALVELRRYRLHPGRRDELVELFERELVEPQEACGLRVLGHFHDLDEPDQLVWLRGFATADPDARGRALAAFYGGPVWREHAAAANATMVDSDDVLLLRPARPDTGLPAHRPPHPPVGTDPAGRPPVVVTTWLLDRPAGPDAVAAALAAGPAPLAVLVTAAVPNRFPALPVREGEHALVRLDTGAAPDPAAAGLGPAHVAHLVPAARSLLPPAWSA